MCPLAGGKLQIHYAGKRGKGVRCSKCPRRLPGIPHLRPAEYSRKLMSKRQKTVNRAYGGSMCASCVRERIVRAFLVEEQKIVKKVVKIQKAKEKSASKAAS